MVLVSLMLSHIKVKKEKTNSWYDVTNANILVKMSAVVSRATTADAQSTFEK